MCMIFEKSFQTKRSLTMNYNSSKSKTQHNLPRPSISSICHRLVNHFRSLISHTYADEINLQPSGHTYRRTHTHIHPRVITKPKHIPACAAPVLTTPSPSHLPHRPPITAHKSTPFAANISIGNRINLRV